MYLLKGNSVDVLDSLEPGSVQLIVTSPPYDGLRTYGREKLEWNFELTALRMHRVLCDGGIVCWNVNDETIGGSESLTSCRQKLFFVDKVGFRCHDTMFYGKLNFSHPEKNRYHQVVEYVFILSKGAPRCFNPLIDRRNKTAGCVGNLGVNTFTLKDGTKSVRSKQITKEWGMRHNLWVGKTRGQEEMCRKLPWTAMMPKWLARDLIKSFSNEGDVVLDPFAGSGTVGFESEKIKRKAIMIDDDPEAISLMWNDCLRLGVPVSLGLDIPAIDPNTHQLIQCEQ